MDTIKSFKRYKDLAEENPLNRIMDRNWGEGNVVDSIRKYIEEHYMEEIQLGELALVAHMSPTYLSGRFKRETGTSFTAYLMNFRLEKAKELLSSASIPCKEVARRVGYEDYIQFSKMFKKYIGLSPKDYQSRK